jgi:hypothetical protein
MNPNYPLCLRVALVLCSLHSSGSLAQESKLATQAVRCSAIFTIFEVANADDSALAPTLIRARKIFEQVHASERHDQTLPAAQEIQQKREALLQEFRAHFKDREPYLQEEGVLCGAWADGFLAQGENYGFIPVIPKVIAPTSRATYTRLGSTSFARWAALPAKD